MLKFLVARDRQPLAAGAGPPPQLDPADAGRGAGLLALAALGVSAAGAGVVVALMALASLASATQDIATDGLVAVRGALARANALQIGGTMVGFFFGGPGCLMLAGHVGQPAALGALAAVVAASLLLAASWRELPAASDARAARRRRPAPGRWRAPRCCRP